ncbi:hypothetical protein N8Z77_05940 [Planktomarina sp.]|jgi:recombinational DNA repair ATPase RecF|nr:hypothetical protein [Planktomarina sp.]|tara:strand:- start:121 stop:309 length:189 start_codon:yes stop_codon:yes gene_type:complete
MLTDAFNERIRVTIGENDLNMLSNNQVAELIKRYEKLLKQKNGQLDEISYDDIIAVWDKLQK